MSALDIPRGPLPVPISLSRLQVVNIRFLLMWCLVLSGDAARGQHRQEAQTLRRVIPRTEVRGEPEDVLRIDTDLILVDVAVTDNSGRPVRGLQPENFRLYEDGLERPVAFFNVEKKSDPTRPLAIVFALDKSGSMTFEEMGRLRTLVRNVTSELAERPCEFAAMSFGMHVRRLEGFTSDRQKLDRAFERLAHEPEGLSTHAYDAIDDAIRLLVHSTPRMKNGLPVKRTVIVISDGFPVGDTASPSTVIERANAADVSIYTVTLPSYSGFLSLERKPLPTPLDVSGLAEKTGGGNVYVGNGDYEALVHALSEDVTSSYALAFYPADDKRRDGRFHALHVEGPPALTLHQSRFSYVGTTR